MYRSDEEAVLIAGAYLSIHAHCSSLYYVVQILHSLKFYENFQWAHNYATRN